LNALDIDGDWDAEAHDRQMAAIQAETDGLTAGRDDEKPTWDDDIDIGDIIPPQEDDVPHTTASRERKKEKKKEKKKRMKGDNDAGVDVDEMDAEAPKEDRSKWDEVEWDGTEEMRKRVLDQYMSELYELEFNDMVRTIVDSPPPHTCYSRALIRISLQVVGMPTRFRYTPVAKTSYGLTAAEVLLADEKDLNEYVGLKKLAPYRKAGDTWDAKRGERLWEFKKKVSMHVDRFGTEVVEVDGERRGTKKRRGKKERMREKAVHPMSAEVEADAADVPQPSNKATKQPRDEEDEVATTPVKKKRRRQKKSAKVIEEAAE
jgi:protein KRI1